MSGKHSEPVTMPTSSSAMIVFRGMEYQVSMDVVGGDNLIVEVQDRLSADQWRGSFDGAYLEDLTSKTGNYKQFSIFVSMLESAIAQTRDAVSLDLLTYGDLELLRNKKPGTGSQHIPTARNASFTSKRYLILTYTAEFDRIHYPLPLPYVGKPDPRALQDTISQLRHDLRTQKQQGSKDHKHKELEKLKRDFDNLLQEKEELEEEFVEYKRQVNNTTKGAAAKEVRMLKEMVKSMEQDLLLEQTKHQRSATKRGQEYRQLLHELDEVKASERNLRVRVKSLTNELAIYKRSRASKSANTSSNSRHSASHRNSYLSNGYSSRENSFTRSARDTSRVSGLSQNSSFKNRSRDRSLEKTKTRSLDRSRERSWDRSRERSNVNRPSYLRDRSQSRERSLSRDRPSSRERLKPNLSRGSTGFRSRTPSPAGARYPRFDPTAFIKEKERQTKETELKQKRLTRSKLGSRADKKSRASPNASVSGSYRHSQQRSRASSIGSLRSRTSSVESLSDVGLASDSSDSRYRKDRLIKPPGKLSSAWSNADDSYQKDGSNKILSSTPDRPRTKRREKSDAPNEYLDRSAEISEIDDRLNRLQQFMKNNML